MFASVTQDLVLGLAPHHDLGLACNGVVCACVREMLVLYVYVCMYICVYV